MDSCRWIVGEVPSCCGESAKTASKSSVLIWAAAMSGDEVARNVFRAESGMTTDDSLDSSASCFSAACAALFRNIHIL